MTDTLLLVGREYTRTAARQHAERLRQRAIADSVAVATYTDDPADLEIETPSADGIERYSGDDTYVVPIASAPDHDTTRALPGVLPTAHHCEPVGTSPAIVRGLTARAREVIPPAPDVSLALVAFGDASGTSGSGSRATTEAHAARLRETTAYGEITTAYLLENPAVECLRYNLSSERAVVVPFFITACAETEHAIPDKLELDRGGLDYAAPLGTHETVTDAIEAEFLKARTLGSGTAEVRPIATDGRGR